MQWRALVDVPVIRNIKLKLIFSSKVYFNPFSNMLNVLVILIVAQVLKSLGKVGKQETDMDQKKTPHLTFYGKTIYNEEKTSSLDPIPHLCIAESVTRTAVAA